MEQVNNIEIENFANFFFIGSWSIIDILLILIGLDVVSGIIKGSREHSIKSSVANLGIAKKVSILFVIIVANIADLFFKANGVVVNGTVSFYLIGEAISVLENCAIIGVPLPDVLKKRLGILDDKKLSE
ncbi:phage holin family protein [Staphylococcus haemolyticus]|uniref:phage holin family protein n=1 Tax=Staphylococcus haemolyticus TaxID=1283 RepID=UPI0039BD2069